MLPQLKHFIHLTIAATVLITTVATALPNGKPVSVPQERTRNSGNITTKIINVSSRYITTQTTRLTEGETKMFIINLCEAFKGKAIIATILLHSNYHWNPDKGIINTFIVDDTKKELCRNVDPGTGSVIPTCTITDFKSTSNILYMNTSIKAHAGNFSIDVELLANNPTKDNPKEGFTREIKTRETNTTPNHKLHLKKLPDEYLTEVIVLKKSVVIDIEESAQLTATFCPTPDIKQYNISSTVTSAEGSSSFTQYICNALPCDAGGPSEIAKNRQQTPKNEVIFTPQACGTNQVYVKVVCWAGPKSTTVSGYACEFVYTGEIVPIK